MNPQAGLSFEQAPPFALPLRFFLTAPLFLLAAAGLIAFSPETLASRWTPQALALTHALTLGFLSMTMLGALLQLLPVVAGTPLRAPRRVAWLSHIALTAGSLALMTGFLTAAPVAFGVGIVLLGSGLAVFLAAAAISLMRAVTSATVNGMRLAAISLGITLLLGVALALQRTGGRALPAVDAMLAAHVSFGLLGWVLLLVIGVAYQVVPMFQITPPYPPRLSRWLIGTAFVLLLLRAAVPLLPEPARTAATLLTGIGLAAMILTFALVTLRLQSRRRRKLPDVTLDFWRVGMLSLIACVAVWLTAQFSPAWADSNRYPLLLGVLFIGGFAVSVVSGMLYKIVPFLAWFHLQAQLQARAGSIPTMRDMIAGRWARMQYRLHLAACALLVAATGWPQQAWLAGGVLALSALLLEWNLLSATRRYVHHGGQFG
ncbi:MAG TPA: hypothetical protein PLE48_12725 [Thiobacillus sp.]|nr:MAG: hypothetical protein B7Y50_05550 [Hydrogenophilales bacterium 28-61-11]OYZ57943.1 MAG: hypothetical protein B7Y21_05320 [Hydrogenophilales bacterium 16-61-112]OZA47461.1 MAG: hypothetical protein B7X81_05340 [Hydrogenophilales bacterium 17-61-76]HQT32249.1 hypothetical protein [Thiobacillus sp.]HQT71274.1 hypothetical protein [Thiobacillus sp.]